jgi:hypothetical protein
MLRRLLAATLFALPLALAACAVPSHYAGVDLRAGSGIAPEVQTLAERARSGDKQSQLDLGIRYETGSGVPQDMKQARRLYRMAAATTGGTIYVYQPPVKKGGRGGVVPVNLGPVVQGLEAAKVRLAGAPGWRRSSLQ